MNGYISVSIYRPKMRRQAGVTLVELMVALVMSLFLVGGILAMHLSGRASFLDNSQISRIQENVRFASDYMIRDIRTAGLGHEAQILENFAEIEEVGGEPRILRVRFAGRGHCSETFQEYRLVENEYTVDDDGNLTCSGRAVPGDADGGDLITDEEWIGPIALVGGLSDINFTKICPDGSTTCDCDLVNNFDNACIGVRVNLEFEGLVDPDAEGEDLLDKRSIELTAAFRNVVLAQKNAIAFADVDED
jgi:type II secretory pathway pseudopilin PulG